MTRQVYLLSGVRTAIGTFGGSLASWEPTKLGAVVAAAAIDRAGVAPADIGHVVYGNVIPTGPRDAYLARISAIDAGVPKETPALTLNRLCGSGVQAIISAAQTIMQGDTEVAWPTAPK